MDFAFEIRAIPLEDLRERDRYEISGSDAAVLVLVDGEAVAWCDDYGTAHLITGTDAQPREDDVEQLMRAVEEFWEAIS